MFYQPDSIVYLWILPVLALVVLPAFWLLFGMLYQLFERSRLSDVRGFIDLNTLTPPEFDNLERRRHPRIRIEGPKVKVARQDQCCKTFAANVSSRGICLRNIPRKMYDEVGDKLKVVFRTRERDYTMFVQPKWRKSGGRGYMLGAEIIQTPPGWEGFVDTLYPVVLSEAA